MIAQNKLKQKTEISKLKNTADLRKVTLFKNLLSNQKEEGKVSLNLSEEDEVKPVPQAFEAPLPIAPVVHETVEEPPTNAHAWTEKEEENVPIVTVEEPTSISQEESRKTGGLVSSLPPPPIVTPTSPFMKMSAMVPSLAQSSNASGGSFQYNVLENIVQDCLADFRDQTRSDIQNMHIELLRQFQIQKVI